MTLREDLERVIASDPVMTEERMAGIVSLARAIADQADSQLAKSGTLESRIIASYAGMLAQINRTIRDDRALRRKDKPKELGGASRLAVMRDHARKQMKADE